MESYFHSCGFTRTFIKLPDYNFPTAVLSFLNKQEFVGFSSLKEENNSGKITK